MLITTNERTPFLEDKQLNSPGRTTVVLADDHAMVRESLARVLDASEEILVVGQAGDGIELIKVIGQQPPHCLIMDYSMPNHDPPVMIAELLERYPALKILVLTVHENVHYAVRTLEAGAHGYLIKSAAVDELVNAIHSIIDGNIYISKKISRDVLSLLRRPRGRRGGVESLSQREFELLRTLGTGASLQESAKKMQVSVSTVSTYRSRILEKLGLATTGDLVRFAIENQLDG